MFSLLSLHYDDCLSLADRLWSSLLRGNSWRLIRDVRCGLNAGSDRLRGYLFDVLGKVPVPVLLVEPLGDPNPGKYPIMRQLLRLDPKPAKWVMWFDDDSYVLDPVDGWLALLSSRLPRCGVLGSRYKIRQRGLQWQWIQSQPWYTGKQVGPDHVYNFVTGGWWVACSHFLDKWGYPWPQLHHNGGDSILGELCRQQGANIVHFRHGVAINADDNGKESAAPRRGISTPWPGEKLGAMDRSRHETAVVVWRKRLRGLWEHSESPAI